MPVPKKNLYLYNQGMKNFDTSKLESFGVFVPEILLPKNIDIKSWSVIACDQYTQDLDYWKNAEKNAEGKPSTLNLILPEVYLNSPDKKERIAKIRNSMNEYLDSSNGVFDSARECMVYIERKTAFGRTRKGLVAQIDLETYEWKPFSKAFIRATEATIVDRIPPRKEIRKGAALELPHIMLLVNDEKKQLIEGCGNLARKKTPLYKGELMLNSGSITGWALNTEDELETIYNSLREIKSRNTDSQGNAFIFAVGDGNHSLATAKAVWDEYKAEHPEERTKSPVRYALVEIVNIYDCGLTFEPIHRVLFGAEADKVIDYAKTALGGRISQCDDEESLSSRVQNSHSSFGFVYVKDGQQKYILLECDFNELAVARFQPILDEFIEKNKGDKPIEMDYIHGKEEVFRLGRETGTLSILLPPIAKDSFFETINSRGPLPRKSFSMGEASEKRFYLECRKLFNC